MAKKRKNEDILRDLRDVESQLSPENLYWDGERDKADAARAERALLIKRNRLVAELGRQPTHGEIYG